MRIAVHLPQVHTTEVSFESIPFLVLAIGAAVPGAAIPERIRTSNIRSFHKKLDSTVFSDVVSYDQGLALIYRTECKTSQQLSTEAVAHEFAVNGPSP